MRDIYSEKVILFALMMDNATWCLRRRVIGPSAWVKQAAVVKRNYDIPLGVIEQQAFRADPRAYQELVDTALAA